MRYFFHFISDWGWESDTKIFSISKIPFSFHTGLRMGIRYGHLFYFQDTVFISYGTGVLFTCENGMKRIGLVSSHVSKTPSDMK